MSSSIAKTALIHQCGEAGCDVVCKLRCGTCRRAMFCCVDHQKKNWKSHKKVCVAFEESAGGYPQELVSDLYSVWRSRMMPISAEEFAVLETKMHVLFKCVRPADPRQSAVGCSLTVVDRDAWQAQFDGFTSRCFASWPKDLWDNVLIGGGSVLASLLPPDSRFRQLSPPPDMQYLDYNFTASGQGRISNTAVDNSIAEYMQKVRWPTGDVDIFLYGLSSVEQASEKCQKIISELRKTIKTAEGVGYDVIFTKTDNTISIVAGPARRTIQIITRIYLSKSDILNSFDVDCCCCGYDGETVLITERCIEAIRTRVNVTNLSIRGDAYEHRLLKYAERGWGIGVPELHNSLTQVDKAWLSFKTERCHWQGESLSGNDWGRWAESTNLERLMMCEGLAKKLGILHKPFAKRRSTISQLEQETAEGLQFKIRINPCTEGGVSDTYSSMRNPFTRTKIFPATTDLSALGLKDHDAVAEFKVQWRLGNMPRKPLSFEAWSKTAFIGVKRGHDYDWEQRASDRAREAEERKARQLAAELKAKKDRVDELAAIQREADERAQEIVKRERDKSNKEKEKLKSAAASALAEAEGVAKAALRAKDAAEQSAASLKSEAKAAAAFAAAAKEDGSGDHNCVVCWSEVKCIMIEPCRHVPFCEACFKSSSFRCVECPICRGPLGKFVKLFL